MKIVPSSARSVFTDLFRRYGPQFWWPANSAFEVMIGAVLTQNTAWRNVEKALANLKAHKTLNLRALNALRDDTLATCLRPAGTYNVKLKRVRALCEWLVSQGGISRLHRRSTSELRSELLNINGVGPETADAILLYALQRPVFVIDAYTRRLAQRLGWASGKEPYDHLRSEFEYALSPDPQIFNEYHALIVVHGKQHCRSSPLCVGCCLAQNCDHNSALGRSQ